MPNRDIPLLAMALGLLIVLASPASAGPGDNPRPASGDIALPMPGGSLKMVFRKVVVPGKDFWGAPSRRLTFGNIENTMFETQRDIMVAGSFREGRGWYYLMGKYEMSIAQAAAILGKGDIDAGARLLADRTAEGTPVNTLPTLRGAARDKALALPLNGVSWFTVQDVIAAYNAWCFADRRCLAALPRHEGMPGYFRLPTEVEWEYAAKGGADALPMNSATPFDAELPFDPADWQAHAYIEGRSGSPIRIGQKEPTVGGFHDLFGNVRELVGDRFQPIMAEGRPGGLTVRGQAFTDKLRALRTSLRSEQAIYRWDGQAMVVQKSLLTGFRLGIGSATVASRDFRARIEEEYDKKAGITPARQSVASATPPPASTPAPKSSPAPAPAPRQSVVAAHILRPPATRNREPLEDITTLARTLASRTEGQVRARDVAEIAQRIAGRASKARQQFQEQEEDSAYQVVRLALAAAEDYGWHRVNYDRFNAYLQSQAARDLQQLNPAAYETRRKRTANHLRQRDTYLRSFRGYFAELQRYEREMVMRVLAAAPGGAGSPAKEAAIAALTDLARLPWSAPVPADQIRRTFGRKFTAQTFE